MKRPLMSSAVALATCLCLTTPAAAASHDAEVDRHGGSTAALLPNGDFEDPPEEAGFWLTFGEPDVLPGDWHVLGTIDLVSTEYISSGHGEQSVDLNGADTGGLWTELATRRGDRYVVRFLYSGNPDVAACGEPLKKTMLVTAGPESKRFRYNTEGRTLDDPGWRKGKVTFRAKSAVTRLEFRSESPSCAGPMLDYVRLEAQRHH
jgi:hypothetical protein